MAHPTLRSPSQSAPVQILLWIFECCASLKLAVTLIFSMAFILAWATFVEASLGSAVVGFAIYDSWWFILMCTLLAV
ncbi:MAG: hypothetical protein N2C14_16220, partial [Planctomycetales bacterium]